MSTFIVTTTGIVRDDCQTWELVEGLHSGDVVEIDAEGGLAVRVDAVEEHPGLGTFTVYWTALDPAWHRLYWGSSFDKGDKLTILYAAD